MSFQLLSKFLSFPQIELISLTWGLHPLVMVGVDADFVLLEMKGILTCLNSAQLMMAVKIWPSPQSAVDNMGKPLPVRYLQAAIQGSDWTADAAW